MKIKHIAGGAFLLNTLLFGSYYAISKEVLSRVDPIVFSFCEMMTLVPFALFILARSWRHMTPRAVKSGFILGSCLCLGLFMLSVALRYNSATGTGFFPALNGLLAALFAWVFLRQPITKVTWLAGTVSVAGAFLLMANADMGGLRGSLIAFIGGLFCTMYIFLVDHEQKGQAAHWPLVAIQLLTMALWGNLIALLFGDWHITHLELPKDALVILYIGLGTVFLPTVISLLLQKHISAITVSFICILEPILSSIIAYLYLHEVIPLNGYLGGGLIVAGVLIHTWGSLERPGGQPALRQGLWQALQRFHISQIVLLLYPLLCSGIGAYIVSRLGGFPPPVWRDLFQLMPQLPTMIEQGQATDVCIMVAQSLSWLIAWSSLLLMGGIAAYHVLEKLFTVTGQDNAGRGKTYSYNSQIKLANVGTIPTQNVQGAMARASKVSSIPTQPNTAVLGPAGSGPAPDQPRQMDVRLLRQMGYTPYSVSTRSAKRKPKVGARVEASPRTGSAQPAPTLQQLRLQHRIRLTHMESSKVTEPLPVKLPSTIEKQEMYSDPRGNSYFYWDEFSHIGKGLSLSREKGQNDETK